MFHSDMCPKCGYTLDSATCITERDKQPSEGDLTVCIRCSSMLVFGEKLLVRELSPEAYQKLPEEIRAQLALAVRAVKVARQKLGPLPGERARLLC